MLRLDKMVLNERDRLKVAIVMLVASCMAMITAGAMQNGAVGASNFLLTGYIITFVGGCLGLIFCLMAAKFFRMSFGEVDIVFLKLCAIFGVVAALFLNIPLLAAFLGFLIIVGGMVILFDELTFFEVFVSTVSFILLLSIVTWGAIICGIKIVGL